MTIKLLHHTPLWVASTAIRKCWASEDKSDTEFCEAGSFYVEAIQDEYGEWQPVQVPSEAGTKDKELIHRVGNKNKHSSTLEHLNYSFDIDGISRACLQELARHRHASMSVKSTRYTLKELKGADLNWEGVGTGRANDFLVLTSSESVNERNRKALYQLQQELNNNLSNDLAKFALPEAYKTSLVWTINARSLQNFLALRTDKSALWEIRELAYAIYDILPEEHKYLFGEFLYRER